VPDIFPNPRAEGAVAGSEISLPSDGPRIGSTASVFTRVGRVPRVGGGSARCARRRWQALSGSSTRSEQRTTSRHRPMLHPSRSSGLRQASPAVPTGAANACRGSGWRAQPWPPLGPGRPCGQAGPSWPPARRRRARCAPAPGPSWLRPDRAGRHSADGCAGVLRWRRLARGRSRSSSSFFLDRLSAIRPTSLAASLGSSRSWPGDRQHGAVAVGRPARTDVRRPALLGRSRKVQTGWRRIARAKAEEQPPNVPAAQAEPVPCR